MKSVRHQHEQSSGNRRRIPCYADFPIGEFAPLIKECFGNEICLDDLIFHGIFPLYHQFLAMINRDYAVVAKDSHRERKPPLLESRLDLRPIKGLLSRSTKEHFPLKFNIYSPPFEAMRNLTYSQEEIIKFKDMGVRDRYLLEGIFDFGSAYYYWSLSNIIDGRRIGCVGYTKDRKPNIFGDFYEFDMMQKFIPTYDEKKALSFSIRDFLINASTEEVGERLVDILVDFGQEVRKNNPTILERMEKQIKEYGKRLEWDPVEFFKNVGYK